MSITYPGLLIGGATLVLVPIIIHLLNKRKFKIVDWAAMDFLFEADKKNRRRVRLEDLVILLLRVLAVLLLASLFARPFLSGASAAILGGNISHERIVLLDDSPSMEARQQGPAAMQQSRRVLTDLLRDLSTNHASDTLTVLVTSRPRVPIVSEAVLTPETVNRLTAELGAWPASSRPANYADALVEVEKLIAARTSHLNRMVYVISDQRRADWEEAKDSARPAGPITLLRRLAEKTSGCYLVDVGGPQTENLAITSLLPVDNVLAAGQPCRFEVTVRNNGPADVTDVGVRLTPAGSPPMEGRLDRVPAGKSAVLPMTLTFNSPESDHAPEPVAVTAELIVPAGSSDDRLAADNSRHYPARVVQGVQTLVVDGDPKVDPRKSETFFLRRALAPPGDLRSGIVARIVNTSEFETLELDPFQVIFLANVDQLSDARRTALEQWVKRGGGLVMALGDQLIDVGWFNAQMYRGGEGLSPVELQSIQGNENRRQWSMLDVVAKKHDVVSIYEGENNPFLDGVKVFRWWQCQLPEGARRHDQSTTLLARLTDANHSPLIIEQKLGKGRVMLLTTALDQDWSTWPQEIHSYWLFMHFLTKYMAQSTAQAGLIDIGESIKVPLEVVRHKLEGATLLRPSGERVGVHPAPDQASAADAANRAQPAPPAGKPATAQPPAAESTWHLQTTETDAPGVYRVDIALHDGGAESVLFAANLATDEGQLAPLGDAEARQQLQDSRVQLLSADSLLAGAADDSKAEWWLMLLGCLGIVLGAEQALAWVFGRRR